MGRPNQLKINLYKIEAHFQTHPLKSFTYNKLYITIEEKKEIWGFSYKKKTKDIIDFLVKNQYLYITTFSENYHSIDIYSWKTHDDFTVISGLKSDSFFMYYSALYLHGLTQQIPKTFYLNTEHYSNAARIQQKQELDQEAIDRAFASEQRKSEHTYLLSDKKVILTNSKNTGRLGVIQNINDQQSFSFTNLEKTLIDIVVRPAYAGGVFEILEAYKLAKEKVNLKRMANYLRKLNYTYPYEQSIGFYLYKAGYNEKDISLFDKNKKYSFYLTYNMRNKEYSERWRLYYPKGF